MMRRHFLSKSAFNDDVRREVEVFPGTIVGDDDEVDEQSPTLIEFRARCLPIRFIFITIVIVRKLEQV